MSPNTIFTIPEEIRQEIRSYLNYRDVWSLKQTSLLFYRVVEIPTIKSFLHCPCGRSLRVLEECLIIPMGYEACHYCKRLLPSECFSRFQRRLTAARQHSFFFDYASWKPEKHYCLECGVKNHHYPGGKNIYVGFGFHDYMDEAVFPCKHCGNLSYYLPGLTTLCVKCDEDTSLCITSSPSCLSLKTAFADGREQSQKTIEPSIQDYQPIKREFLLALIGERLLPENDSEGWLSYLE